MNNNINKIALLKDEIITVEKDISFHNTQVERLTEQLEALQQEVETLEQIESISDDEMTDEEYKESLGNDAGKYDKSFNEMMGNPMEEINQLIDEIINPDDYVLSDTKDLESSIV